MGQILIDKTIDKELEILQVLAKVAGYKEHQMDEHTQRIAHYSQLLAKAAGLNETVQDIAFHSSQFYDLGKVGITDDILLKGDKLSDAEFEVVKTHTRIGYDILKYTQNPYLKAGAVISYSHHEKFDGSGYPIGLVGETIPILGRIVAIADVFDALCCEKVYKKAWSVEEACEYLLDEKEKHFDGNLVDLFMENLEEIKAIREKFPSS